MRSKTAGTFAARCAARAAVLSCTALLLAGCAHHTDDVRDSGNGSHSVTASANWGGYTGSREEAIAQANAYCGRSGQTVGIDGFTDQPGTGRKGEQTSTMAFRCTNRPALQLR